MKKLKLLLLISLSILLGALFIYFSIYDDFSSYDHYQVLGVKRTASLNHIKTAYRSMSLKHHPDKSDSTQSTARFVNIAEAYNILADADARKMYDEMLYQKEKIEVIQAIPHLRDDEKKMEAKKQEMIRVRERQQKILQEKLLSVRNKEINL